jgi:hypothetical protein
LIVPMGNGKEVVPINKHETRKRALGRTSWEGKAEVFLQGGSGFTMHY